MWGIDEATPARASCREGSTLQLDRYTEAGSLQPAPLAPLKAGGMRAHYPRAVSLLPLPDLSLQAALIAGCKRRGIKVLAVAGAGAKADPTRLRVVDVSEASVDPLAKAVRQK